MKIEKNLINDDFDTEALEGLQDMQDQKALPHIVEQLNRDLKKKTTKKKVRKKAPEIKDDPWLWIAIIIILLLIVISYIVIHKHLQEG